MWYRILADLILVVHVAFVAFIILGLIFIFAGGRLGWRWVRNPWFRVGHLLAIVFVVAETWVGQVCPLTTIEASLRREAGDATYEGGFIAHWLHELLYIDAPTWAFAVCYTAFAGLVVASWWRVRPRKFRPTVASDVTEQP